ncbi:complex I subunit 5 family protein [Methylocaldum szegediense]|uniref:Formate hydrogenlyase subunit 3/multisubunit Na+/H+ antiporter MnhD subunit n=1 Tax=Methylocaldum szegediense TaxID=73780 RepID=A0ABN8X0N9_9GAMM|nr:complex I subunit 5 family protein [Methylocaldum szegediense]CAI8798738.1 Formate hydrogenlyase subunit 3/multisubunit Na+/H+ antiporter MnhD subunit [Methylocaldum szegediense]
MSPGWLAASALLTPLVLATALFVAPRRFRLWAATPWAALPGVGLAFAPEFKVELPSLLLGMSLGLDATGRVFLIFTALLWLISGLYAGIYLAADSKRSRFAGFFLGAMAGNLGVLLAQDVTSFYLFFALMTLSVYGLVVHEGGKAPDRAGRIYLILAVLGEAILLIAFLLSASAAESLSLDRIPQAVAASPLRNLILTLFLGGFGVKVGLLGLHVWLPLAHPVAPTPASAVLSGVIIKAGLMGWLRFLPLGQEAIPGWGYGVMAGGLAAAFYGAAVGLVQKDSKTVLAYSSISQMGIITVPIGIALAVPTDWPAALTAVSVYAVHHAFAKGALFLGAGVARTVARDKKRLAWIMAGLLIPALSLAGAPFTTGALAKDALKRAMKAVPEPWQDMLAWMLSLAAIGTTVLLMRFLYLVRNEALAGRPGGSEFRSLGYTWGLAVLGVLTLSWIMFTDPARAFLEHALEPAVLWSESWPVGSGILLAWLFGLTFIGIAPRIPAGDLLVPIERLVLAVWKSITLLWSKARQRRPAHVPWKRLSVWLGQSLTEGQAWLESTAVSGTLLILLVLFFALALLSTH